MMRITKHEATAKPTCDLGIQLHEMFVNALRSGRQNTAERERNWQRHKEKCPVCAGVKGKK